MNTGENNWKSFINQDALIFCTQKKELNINYLIERLNQDQLIYKFELTKDHWGSVCSVSAILCIFYSNTL